jgi:Na+/H+ antiporter NhaD/arsenite permease-like protein
MKGNTMRKILSITLLLAMLISMAGVVAMIAAATLPVFVAMMFGGTLGGNATLIGASANIVSVGICAKHGQHVSFGRFVRYGLPITLAQLVLAAIYVIGLTWLTL